MKRITYLLYLIFVELPPLIVFLAATTGFTNIYVNYERANIYNMARAQDEAISLEQLPEQLERRLNEER